MSQFTLVYIYALYDPSDNHVHYIGATRHPAKRLLQHTYPGPYGHGKKREWVIGLLQRQQLPTMRILEVATEQTWEDRERLYIALYRVLEGPALLNIADGGLKGTYTAMVRRRQEQCNASGRILSTGRPASCH